MLPYTHSLNTRFHTKFGRTPGSVKLIFGLQTVVADARQEEQEKYEVSPGISRRPTRDASPGEALGQIPTR
jgi:hypothetical protein